MRNIFEVRREKGEGRIKSHFSNLKSHFRGGQSLVELLLAFGLAAVFLPALATGLIASRNGRAQETQRLQAVALVKEEEEALRNVRESGWANFADFSDTGPVQATTSGSVWILTGGAESINGFSRQAVITSVNRDAGGAIALLGTNDPSTKKVEITVSWANPLPSSVGVTKYMTRYLDNLSYTETTQTQFNAGAKTNVKVQATSGSGIPDDGEIVLSQTGGYGDWCAPALTFTDLDLPKNGVANAVSAIQGQAAAGTGDNSSGVSYANVTISDPAFPAAPVANVSGTFDGYKTNGVFTEQNYAYLATDNNAKEVVIIDLTQQINGKYVEAGYFDAPGNGNGNSVYALGNVGYMTSGNKFFTFDLSSHSGSRTRLNGSGGLELAGTGVKIMVVGSTAYVATSGTSNQLQIINVTNPASPTISRNVSVAGQGGRDIFVNVPQNRAYLVTGQSASQSEFFLINLANYSVLGTYDTQAHGDMDPKGVVAVSGGRAIVVGTGGQEYQVLNLQTESSPTWCGGLDINSGINGIATVFTAAQRAYSYIITGDANAEFKIIEGGPGAGNGSYVPTGTFVSAPYGPIDPATAFNRFLANIDQPVANDVQIQVAVADAVGGACTGANYTFVGSDGSGTGTGNYFTTAITGTTTISGPVPFGTFAPSYQNPGKCFKYKVILSTNDATLTPVFRDFSVNYSP
ncbi:MAG: hypothetical protein UY21_C0003G0007 [Microgenomates group bacterium GW2011_GWA1_48_10]|nr:MAG: hypothetical protein UY21_C0003G0007 [Microgenomates group bacterium GW2011_GWA1_48_10]